jgi:serine/threonine protein kinase HipA of HipAB toxin-antitoxin module
MVSSILQYCLLKNSKNHSFIYKRRGHKPLGV